MKPSVIFICTLFSFIIMTGCRKENNIAPAPLDAPVTLKPDYNFVENPSFSEWSFIAGLPENWRAMVPEKDHSLVSRAGNGVQMEANATGTYFLYQPLKLQKNHFYKVSVKCEYDIKDYFPGGVYVMDSSFENILGQSEKAYQSGSGNLEFIFNSGNREDVNIALGFPNGINAKMNFQFVAVNPYVFKPVIIDSYFSAYLNKQLKLSFNRQQFDASIEKIADFMNGILLCEYFGGDCRSENARLIAMLTKQGNYPYFVKDLKEIANIQDSYCQRSSLALDEILSNEFGIPVRQVHMNFQDVGKHQFIEYWNPYLQKWIAIDPCFSCQYIRNGVLLGTSEFGKNELPGLMKTFGSNLYYTSLDELINLWDGFDELMIQDNYYISFPFGDNTYVPKKKPIKAYKVKNYSELRNRKQLQAIP